MILYTSLLNLPIVTNNSQIAGYLGEIIISQDNGRVLGFKVTGTKNSGRSILASSDILEISPRKIVIADTGSLSRPEEVIRIHQILDSHIHWLGLLVQTESGKKIGKLEDIAFERNTFAVKKIFVAGSLLKSNFLHSIIPASKIIKVMPKKLIIEDNELKIKDTSPALAKI
jgi:sporulation protein YlmC with PRC-barrel domain